MTTITDQLAEALRAIREQRDHHAEHGHYRPGTMSDDQCFDDWAADIADTVLAAYDAERAKSYTLAEVRNGTGWPDGARFIAISE